MHHIGSTAVPGLAAKPVLDIVPVASSPVECSEAMPVMAKLGYRYRGENGIDGRFYFDKIVDGRTVVHAHMFPVDHPDVRRHLVFRDYLRSHSDVACDYEDLKRRLASKYRDDRQAYTEAKAEFIGGVIEAARQGDWCQTPEAGRLADGCSSPIEANRVAQELHQGRGGAALVFVNVDEVWRTSVVLAERRSRGERLQLEVLDQRMFGIDSPLGPA